MSIENGGAINQNYLVEYEPGHSHNHSSDDNHGHSHDNGEHHHEHEPVKKFRITQTNSLVFMHVLVGFYLVWTGLYTNCKLSKNEPQTKF